MIAKFLMRSSVSIPLVLVAVARVLPSPASRRMRREEACLGEANDRAPGLSARRTLSVSPRQKVVPTWPSTVTRSSSGPSSTCTRHFGVRRQHDAGESRACARETGVTTIVSSVGTTTGPPAERLYAVEPVGVRETTPSAA